MTRVLLIEDDGRIRDLVQIGLVARGFTATTASDGSSGIDALSALRIDLVLLDPVLPDVDGFALLAAIRAGGPRGVDNPWRADAARPRSGHAARRGMIPSNPIRRLEIGRLLAAADETHGRS